jgi:PAS domain S-box-containing protein
MVTAPPPAPRPRSTVERVLEDYQARLDAATARGPAAYGREFERPPAGVGAHEIDPGKVFRRINAGGLAILGYPAAELLGRRVLDFIVMRETSERAIDRKLAGAAELKPFVRSFVRADGSSVTLLMLDRHIRNAEGEAVGLRTVYAPVDLTA